MKRKIANIIILALILKAILFFCSCATIIYGSSQSINIKTEPKAAIVNSDNGQSCTTPCALNLKTKKGYRLIITADGYEPEMIYISREYRSFALLILDIITIVGGIVDLISGADCSLSPTEVNVSLKHQ